MVTPDAALIDSPKCLRDVKQSEARRALLKGPTMCRLTEFVAGIRAECGGVRVPDFDPLDGGDAAECLFLLEAPGPKAVLSGFVSRNNPDETAKNWFELNREAGIARKRTLIWNVVPWYVGGESSIRPATVADIQSGLPHLRQLLALLPKLRVIALVGRMAGRVREPIQQAHPHLIIFDVPHPSPKFVNRRVGNRQVLLDRLLEVREAIGD